jgi:glycosyltransferase involved in cell wall biosynthesis
MTAPLFTIVVSGYQNEPYLPQCLTSIRNQTFTDFEAICYVEESTDNSLAICEDISKQDVRFKVVSAPKSGSASATRNYAIDHATGEYLAVVDGDDWLATDMFEKLAKKLNETGKVDILSFSAISTKTNEADWENAPQETNFNTQKAIGVFSEMDAIRFAWQHIKTKFYAYTGLSIYKTTFLRENRLYQTYGLTLEDFEWIPRVWFCAKSFAYLNEKFYVYRLRNDSVTTKASTKNFFAFAHHFHSLIAFIQAHPVPNDILAIWSNQWLSLFYSLIFYPAETHSFRLNNNERKQILKIFFNQEYKKLFWKFLFMSSFPKRLALPFVWLASKGLQTPAKLFFRMIYYPLADRKSKK